MDEDYLKSLDIMKNNYNPASKSATMKGKLIDILCRKKDEEIEMLKKRNSELNRMLHNMENNLYSTLYEDLNREAFQEQDDGFYSSIAKPTQLKKNPFYGYNELPPLRRNPNDLLPARPTESSEPIYEEISDPVRKTRTSVVWHAR